MKKLLLALLILAPITAFAITGDSARFDFSNGQPATVDDTSTPCNNTATVRYDFSQGQPAEMLDTTATCTATPAPGITIPTPRLTQAGGTMALAKGTMILP